MHRTLIKFCGLTNLDDVHIAVRMGINFIGFVFYEQSARYVTQEQAAVLRRALPSYVQAVGLFVNASSEQVIATNQSVGLDILQFHGDESTLHCHTIFQSCQMQGNTRAFWQALRLKSAEDLVPWVGAKDLNCKGAPEGLLLDSFSPQFGGSGHGFDWSWVARGSIFRPSKIPIIASGGLSPSNVADAVKKMQPFAVDVSSGIQTSDPRRKDALLMERFVEQVIKADALLV